MSTEQRDKALRDLGAWARPNQELRSKSAGYSLGFERGFNAAWAAHAATMPDGNTLIELLQSSQHAPMEAHDRGTGDCIVCPVPLSELGAVEIADAIMKLLSKGGGE